MLTCFGPHLMHVDKAWPHSFARFTALFVFAHYKKFFPVYRVVHPNLETLLVYYQAFLLFTIHFTMQHANMIPLEQLIFQTFR